MKRRRIIVYVATSADGFIARKDGRVDWLDRPHPKGKMKYYVFTHHPPATPVKGVEFVNEPVKDFAARLRGQPGKDIWIMGGAGLIASFVDAGEVDDFIVHVIPTFIGEGIPLIAPAERTLPVTLKGTKQYEDGVVRLHYAT